MAATTVTPRDLAGAKEEALFQLRIGRAAHYFALAVSGALLVDAFLVLFLPPSFLAVAGLSVRNGYFLVFPVLGGLYLAAFGLWVKWESYLVWPWEAHVSWTIGALAANVLLTGVYLGGLAHYGPFGKATLLPWIYPVALLGLSLPFVGFALTWSTWSNSKYASIGTVAIPPVVALVVYTPGLTTSTSAYVLALTLAVGAVLYQMSGSILHLMASGTRVHEQEIVGSLRSRMADVARDLREREQAVRFRENALMGREADLDAGEMSLRHQQESIDATRGQLTTLDADIRTRSTTLQRLQKELALKLSETNSQRRALSERESSLSLREKDLQEKAAAIGGRESALSQREGALPARESEIQLKLRSIEQRESQSRELALRIDARRAEIDRKTEELLARDRELSQKAAEAVPAAEANAAAAAQRESELDGLRDQLTKQAADLEAERAEIARQTEELSQLEKVTSLRAEELAQKESEASRKEAAIAQRETLAESQVQRYKTSLESLEKKIQAVDTKAAILLEKSDAATRQETEVAQRLHAVEERENAAQRQRTELEKRERTVALREAESRSLESELKLQKQALAAGRGRDSLEVIPTTSRPRRSPVRDEAEGGGELTGPLKATTRKLPDRLPTGTPRLDDLLDGGIPPNGHVMLVGDAFVGKEVLMYAFLAEGLKRGEPAIIVTASRPPTEVGPKIGLVAPQFEEYEQLGMVRWVDATGSGANGSAAPGRGPRFLTKGPQERAELISAILKAESSLAGRSSKGIRVAFLGLSAVLAHTDEAGRVPFVQNVVAVLKPRNSIAVYALETGTLGDSQMETVLSRMDGVIYFKAEGGKTLLSVQGFGEVATRDWVEYRSTGRGLSIGSFALERIR